MSSTESQYVELGKRYLLVALQATKAFNDAQAALHLDTVLKRQRLGTPEGTAESLDALRQALAVTLEHKESFRQIVQTATAEFAAIIAAMPENQRAAYQQKFEESVNWQLRAQTLFYPNRERWIAAATEICRLIEDRRHTTHFGSEGVGFANDEDVEKFSSLLAVIDETHQFEVAQVKQRSERFAQAVAILGLK